LRTCALWIAIGLNKVAIALNRLAERLARWAAGEPEDEPCCHEKE
jgi:hypothetical protein